MAWWDRFFGSKKAQPTDLMVRDVCELYTEDASRGAKVLERRDGRFYYVERERVEGTIWKNRGRLVGPYETAEAAEHAAVSCPWFISG
jgi:hypothetical protein